MSVGAKPKECETPLGRAEWTGCGAEGLALGALDTALSPGVAHD